jgi:hypothetical protein
MESKHVKNVNNIRFSSDIPYWREEQKRAAGPSERARKNEKKLFSKVLAFIE